VVHLITARPSDAALDIVQMNTSLLSLDVISCAELLSRLHKSDSSRRTCSPKFMTVLLQSLPGLGHCFRLAAAGGRILEKGIRT
jgi:hypothetical protein